MLCIGIDIGNIEETKIRMKIRKAMYARPRFPIEAHKDCKRKQEKLEKRYSQITGKKKRIPMTRVIRIIAEQPLYLDDRDILKMFGKKKVKKIC